MNAPFCKVSRPQTAPVQAPTLQPSIPVATDLPSLIRSINIMIDIVRSLSTSLTVNNTWLPQTPRAPLIPPKKTYLMTPYPDWSQNLFETTTGFVFYKKKGEEPDKDQRAYVWRVNKVEFQNSQRGDDKIFAWKYTKKFDSEFGDDKGIEPFHEDFFERIVNVKWGAGLAVEFGDGAKAPPKADKPAPENVAAEAEPVG